MTELGLRASREMVYSIERLDRKAGTLSVLLSLGAADGVKMTDLCRSIPLERATVSRAVTVLVDFDLVTLTDSAEFPFTRRVALTPLGQRIIRSPLQEWPSILFEHEVGASNVVPAVKPLPGNPLSIPLPDRWNVICFPNGKGSPRRSPAVPQ